MTRLVLLLVFAVFCLPLRAETITLASTTSTQNSGLLTYLLEFFNEDTGIDVKVVAVGTGQALQIARNGDADVLLVHHRPSEDAFVAEGFGTDRRDVMYNDFVIVGPKADPAGLRALAQASTALRRIAEFEAMFISRGDDSGTHKKELEIWSDVGVQPEGTWYRETGSGMGAALNMASALDAYLLTDRGSWITFGNKGDLELLMSGDPVLYNPYGVILVNPELHPHVNSDAALRFVNWLTSHKAQKLIGAFQIEGQQAFCPVVMDRPDAGMALPICPADG